MTKDKSKLFEQMISNMLSAQQNLNDLEDCMSFDQAAVKKISLRNRIIAFGFVKKLSLTQLNKKLLENDCPKLYARNFWEATLIYAFQNGISYPEWRELQESCTSLYESRSGDQYFQDKKITYGELERYISDNSTAEGAVFATHALTKALEVELMSLSDESALMRAMKKNLYAFSSVREKTRYYFCKYLYYYLNQRIEDYFTALKNDRDVDEALSEMLALKVVTTLRRKKGLPEEEKRQLIKESAISSGEIFDEFNYFYFDYISMDWISVLMEYYGDVSDFPADQKKTLAGIFRKSNPNYADLSDEQVLLAKQEELEAEEDAIMELYSKGSENKGYQRNRAGEHAVYKYIKGQLDMERTTFICFLLFFAGKTDMPAQHKLTVARMNEILTESGFAPLGGETDFDGFVEEFLLSDRPGDLLMDEVFTYAKLHENSFLYHIYGDSINYEEELSHTLFSSKQNPSQTI